MSNIPRDDEIDLFEIFQLLWDKKWIIVISTFLFSLAGILFIFNQQETFNVTIPVKNSKPSVFVGVTPLNEILSENEITFQIDNISVFKLFEFKITDNEEVKNILKKNKFIQQQIIDLDELDKEEALLKYAKNFQLKDAENSNIFEDQIQRIVLFKWHDEEEGKNIVKETLLEILDNLKKSVINDVNQLATAIEFKKQRVLDELNLQLSALEENQIAVIEKRISYLLEQAEIAKALGIETNTIDDARFGEAPFFLRGYKAIYKEIELLQGRSKEQRLLMADGYLDVSLKLQLIQSGLASSHLIDSLKIFEDTNTIDLIDINLGLIKGESQSKNKIIMLISVLLGAAISIAYVIFTHAYSKYKEKT